MARVIITIEDGDEAGRVEVSVESDPPFPGPAAKDQTLTTAQHQGLLMLQAAFNPSDSDDDD